MLGPLDNSDPILVEYGNEFDVMGRGYLPEAHFTVHGKNRMDWVAPALITEVNEGNGQYRVYAADHATSDESPAMALRTPKCSDGHYWVEVRTRLPGFASELEISTLERGVLVSWQPPDLGRTYQLNFGQGSSRGGALEVGRTWSDPDSCVHITPVEKGGSGVDTWADVRVNLDVDGNLAPSAYVRMPPTIHTRVRTRLEVLASDPDGDEVAYYWRLDDEPSRNVPVVERYWQGPLTDQVSVTVSDMKGGIAELAPTLNVVEPLASGWSNRDRWGEAHSWEAIHNDGEQVVVVGGSSWVARSDDGINWERGSVPGEFVHFAEVDKLGQVWVAQGLRWRWDLSEFREAVFYSLDGLTWTAALELGHVLWDLRDMACSETSCVAVGLSGLIVRTTDGVNWQQTVWPDRHSLYSVVWNGSEFHSAT